VQALSDAWRRLLHRNAGVSFAIDGALGRMTCALTAPAQFDPPARARPRDAVRQRGARSVDAACVVAVRAALRRRATRSLRGLAAARLWRPWHTYTPERDGVPHALCALINDAPRALECDIRDAEAMTRTRPTA
jgi:hypothetical protein